MHQNPLPIRRPGWGRAPRRAVRREGNSRASQTIIPAQSQCEWAFVRCGNLDNLHILPNQDRIATASAPFPKFVIRRGKLCHELRKQRGTSKPMILVPLFDLKFLHEFAATAVGTSNRRH